jgi:hypothetical protein
MRTATIRRDVKPNAKFTLKKAAPAPVFAAPETKEVRLLRRTLIAMAFLLTFEGLLRKLEPGVVGVLIFLLKDFVILYMGVQLMTRHKLPTAIGFVTSSYCLFAALLFPNILITFGHDPALAVFGAKEYLLYPIVGIAVFVVFQNATIPQVISFCRIIALLMIPTGLIGILQTQISPNSWINLSVDGKSLEDFSSAGHLRISSTFSFVAQFCAFLNMEMFMLVFALYGFQGVKSKLLKLALLMPLPLLVVCAYCTGSRGAVVGILMVLVIAVVLSIVRGEVGTLMKVVIGAGVVAVVAIAFQHLFPSLMATYTVREKGHAFGVSDEVQSRVYQSFTGWIDDAAHTPFFGNGLGIMSNGSDALSSYSRGFRRVGIWTETDIATTLFEGGPYLIFIWYGFRYFIIFVTTRNLLLGTKRELFKYAVVCQADVILVGMTSTLGIQPPIAIWWWLSVGLSTVMWWRSLYPLEEAPVIAAPRATKTGMKPVPLATAAPTTNEARPVPATASTPASPVATKTKGRSSYADRLHRPH